MRVNRIHIRSFGTARDRTYRLSDGLTVFYGPNESGKTTLKSFLTGTLFPDKVPSYPEASTSDSGEVEFTTQSGEVAVVTRKGKKSDSGVAELCGVTGAEYRSVYSLDSEDLRDIDILEKGGLRGRLLAVPGADTVPQVREAVTSERNALIPEGRRSKTAVVATLEAEYNSAAARVKELQNAVNGDSAYASLCSSEKSLEEELQKTKSEESRLFAACSESARNEGMRANREKLVELKMERTYVAYSAKVDETVVRTHNELTTRVKLADESLASKKVARDSACAEFGTAGPASITALKGRVESLLLSSQRHRILLEETARAAAEPDRRGGLPTLCVAGGLLAVIGAAVAATVSLPGGLVVTAIGIVTAVVGFVKRRPRVEKPDHSAEIGAIENEWRGLCRDAGVAATDLPGDCERLSAMLRRAETAQILVSDCETAEADRARASQALEDFLKGFDGEAGFNKAVTDRRRLTEIDAAIASLGDVCDDVPEETVVTDCDVEGSYEAVRSRRSELEGELARVRAAKAAIMSDTAVDEAMNAQADALARYTEAVRRWVRLALEARLLDEACGDLYDRNMPVAYTSANRYLGTMTDGRYTVSADPRDAVLAVREVESGVRKTVKALSTGTEDQVKLALKMGVALSLSAEKPPFILDDVLLTSDDERMKGCAKAVAEFAESVQVLYFTCDSRTMEALAAEGATVVRM